MKGKHGWNVESEYHVIEHLPEDLGRVVALDTEAAEDEEFSAIRTVPYSVQLSDRPGRAFIAYRDHVTRVIAELQESGREIVTHGGKYEMHVLRNAGVPITIKDDTMLMGFLVDPNDGSGLKSMSARYLKCNHPEWKHIRTELYGDEGVFLSYAGGDAELTWRLHDFFSTRMDGLARQYQLEMAVLPVLVEMEKNGVRIDVERLKELSGQCGIVIDRLRTSIHSVAGEEFEIDSPKQVGRILFEKLGIQAPLMTKGGKPSTSAMALAALEKNYPVVKAILLYRRLVKRKGTYLDALPEYVDVDGRVHTQFLQTVTPTKRLASTQPNMMNQPKRAKTAIEGCLEIRRAIVSEPGFIFVRVDYSQIEFRLLLYSTGSAKLSARVNEGEDFHKTTARILLGKGPRDAVSKKERDEIGKTFNYGLSYGMDENGLSFRLGVPLDKARRLLAKFDAEYDGLLTYIRAEQVVAAKSGYSRTFLGRLREVPGINATDRREKGKALRNAINDQIQGGAAEIFKIGMVRLFRDQVPGTRMLLPVHDELLIEVPEGADPRAVAAHIKERLEVDLGRYGKYPVEISKGKSWAELEPVL